MNPGEDTAFPPPEHDHNRCRTDLMRQAEVRCEARHVRLTDQRRRVFAIVAAEHKAIGAYDILAQLAQRGRPPAPVSVYRALEFLVENGLVHRVESLNAYVACARNDVRHRAQFLVCKKCRTVAEIHSPLIEDAIAAGAQAAGFVPHAQIVEVAGLCRICAE
ncbi:MAG: transcriptional repressor [Rhodospirillales bacterium]|nr:transcriptional repressor [Rhodospirillales bacterium]